MLLRCDIMMSQMEINILFDEGFEDCLDKGWLQGIAEQALAAQCTAPNVEMGLVIASQERIRQLNRTYLGRDEPTDVLAFSMLPDLPVAGEPEAGTLPFIMPPDGRLHLGEVIISYPQAVTQAGEHQHSVKREVAILVVHGVLHLLGYEHDEPERESQMRAREAEILKLVVGGLD